MVGHVICVGGGVDYIANLVAVKLCCGRNQCEFNSHSVHIQQNQFNRFEFNSSVDRPLVTIPTYRRLNKPSDVTTTFYRTRIGFNRHFHLCPSLPSVDQETYVIYWYVPILLPKEVIPLVTFVAKL